MTNIFETASRQKLRFDTMRGNLTVEQLWDLPLTSEKNLSLNGIGMDIQATLREMGQDSLVDTGVSPEKTRLKLSLDVIKHIIAVKQAENAASRDQAVKKAEKQKLLALLERKQEDALSNLSAEELEKRIADLDAA